MEIIKIVIVDDHPLVLEGLRMVLSAEPGMEVISTAGAAEELLPILLTQTPDVLILDVGLPTLSGIDITRIITREFPGIRILVLTAGSDQETVKDAIAAGAKGYISKNAPTGELITAIRKIHAGEDYFGEQIAGQIIHDYVTKIREGTSPGKESHPVLSSREIEILKLIGQGLTYKEIGNKLFISKRTVEAHKNNILEKLDLRTVAELIRYAILHGYAY